MPRIIEPHPFHRRVPGSDSLAKYAAARMEVFRTMERAFQSAGTDYISVDPAGDIYTPVVKFFKQRARKIRM